MNSFNQLLTAGPGCPEWALERGKRTAETSEGLGAGTPLPLRSGRAPAARPHPFEQKNCSFGFCSNYLNMCSKSGLTSEGGNSSPQRALLGPQLQPHAVHRSPSPPPTDTQTHAIPYSTHAQPHRQAVSVHPPYTGTQYTQPSAPASQLEVGEAPSPDPREGLRAHT